jgi:uncharacterized protein (UPF0335 family)
VTFDMTCAFLCVRLKHGGANKTLTAVLEEIGDSWKEPLPYNYNTIACAAALVTSRSSLNGSKIVKVDVRCDTLGGCVSGFDFVMRLKQLLSCRDKDLKQTMEASVLMDIFGEESDPARRKTRNSATANNNIRKVTSRQERLHEKKLRVRQTVNLWIAGVCYMPL